tara:strand:- start:1882 stop:2157 length:276 start_codon:yes stop_codon:yes gene_type:complete
MITNVREYCSQNQEFYLNQSNEFLDKAFVVLFKGLQENSEEIKELQNSGSASDQKRVLEIKVWQEQITDEMGKIIFAQEERGLLEVDDEEV